MQVPTCMFIESPVPWQGFGINCRVQDGATFSNQLQGINVQFVRFFMEIDDPGVQGIYYSDNVLDSLFTHSVNISQQRAKYLFGTLRNAGAKKIIFTAKSAPSSWLSPDESRELRGDALVAFARLVASGIIVYRRYGMPMDFLEMCDFPISTDDRLLGNSEGTFITPENYVILVRTFKSILGSRGEQELSVLGPPISPLVGRNQFQQDFIAAFSTLQNKDLLHSWSIHVLENDADAAIYNNGTFSGRLYIPEQIKRTIDFIKWASGGTVTKDILVTKFASKATRYSNGVDYGPSAPETSDYALRLMDNVCGILSNNVSATLFWYLSYKKDAKALYRDTGVKRPQRDAVKLLHATMPASGTVYHQVPIEEDDETNGTNDPFDQTMKIFIVDKATFGFILSRAHSTDAALGKLRLSIRNTEWQGTGKSVTMTISCFPKHVSLSGVRKTVDIYADGTMIFEFENLPYNCCIFGRGDVYSHLPPPEPPTPESTYSFPHISDIAAMGTVPEGTIIFDTMRQLLVVLVANGEWIPCQPYGEANR
jgi:hypothetical protein